MYFCGSMQHNCCLSIRNLRIMCMPLS
jgi:hypothetical protein